MFDHLLRGLKDRLLMPLAMLFRGVAPNVLTLTAFVLGIAAGGTRARRLPEQVIRAENDRLDVAAWNRVGQGR